MRKYLPVILLLSVTSLFGSDGVIRGIDWREKSLAQFQSDEEGNLPFSSGELKSPTKALLYSLVIPGVGQYYCKSYIKGGMMTLAEATFWGLYFYYNGKGDKKTDEYEGYADAHWSEEVFREWLSIADTSEHPPVEHLPPTKDQQYYEMIGKYDWFVTGWDDFSGDRTDPDPSQLLGQTTPHREYYLDMRADANSFYTTAKYFIGASIFNHVTSALEAMWYAKRSNDRLYKKFTNVRFRSRVTLLDGHPTPKLEVVVKF